MSEPESNRRANLGGESAANTEGMTVKLISFLYDNWEAVAKMNEDEINAVLKALGHDPKVIEQSVRSTVGDVLCAQPVGREEVNDHLPDVLKECQTSNFVTNPVTDALHDHPIIAHSGEHQGDFPLSFAQLRFWFLHQMDPKSGAYTKLIRLALKGQLDTDVLRRSLNELIRRHEILRAAFPSHEGNAVMRIMAAGEFPIEQIDLGLVSKEEQQLKIRTITDEIKQQPFELMSRSPMRVKLLLLGPQECTLLLSIHEIACDDWSVGVLLSELSHIYTGFITRDSSPLPELPLQYSDYSVWQHNVFADNYFSEKVVYWQQQLEGIQVLELPTDFKRSAITNGRAEYLHVKLGDDRLATDIKNLSRREEVTVFMTLLTSFKVLLSRYSAQRDIAVGTLVANRLQPETEQLIGPFDNKLVLRTDLSGNPSFLELLQRVRTTVWNAYANQDVPFEQLVEKFQPVRDLRRSPLFQIAFQLAVSPTENLQMGDMQVKVLPVDRATTELDLHVRFEERNGLWFCTAAFLRDLFAIETIRRMLRHWEQMLNTIMSEPETHIFDVEMVSRAEREQIIVDWNRSQTAYPETTVHEAFEECVRTMTKGIAVTCQGRELTYEQLNDQANQLGHYLQKLGVGPERIVGICVDRGVEMLVAMLAVLKVGGAYVPLDPHYPRERLEFMLMDANVPLLLTHSLILGRLPKISARVICMDEEWPRIGHESAQNLKARSVSDNLAYVIYTSGSTGHPRGVSVPHHAIIRLVCETDYIEFKAGDIVLQLAPISFDASTFEIWGCLLNGGRLLIPSPNVLDPAELGDILRQNEIAVLWLTSEYFHVMVEQQLEALTHVRQLLAGGDVLVVSDAIAALRAGCRLTNGYGPTEGTTFACCYRVMDEQWLCHSVPIGKPVANTQVYVLDDYMQLVPNGVSGELYIGGAGLARGYLNWPDRTADKFVPHPFSSEPGLRLYRTGDRVRWLANGNLEFVGRIDHQVKVRGYRLELGEIQARLMEHEGVREAAVVVREDNPGEKRLVAYYIASQTDSDCDQDWKNKTVVRPEQLRAHLMEKLPEYMVPTAYVQLKTMPLTANGKIDRKMLPSSVEDAYAFRGYEEPQSEVEKALAAIWAEVLRLDKVGRQDNFFDLGGHSLLAMRMVSRLREEFHADLPLRTLFANPTLAELAEAIAELFRKSSPPLLKAASETIEGETILSSATLGTLRERGRREALSTGTSETQIDEIESLFRIANALADGVRTAALTSLLQGYKMGVAENRQRAGKKLTERT